MQKLWFVLTVWLVASWLAGCGGGSGPSGLDFQFTPSAPSVSVNSSVQITIQTANAPPIPGCNNGYIAASRGVGPGNAPTLIYYYAPATTGTYQISVSGKIYDGSGKLLNQGSATVNIIVTQ